jgi:GTP-binding protein EngB required for normal cell division
MESQPSQSNSFSSAAEIQKQPELLDSVALEDLKAEQRSLLDTVDNLRRLGVSDLVDLPQIVVVGDQSAGKSSVLEAISRVRFPAKEGTCTRFATELILRKTEDVKIEVDIIQATWPDNNSLSEVAFKETRFSKDDISQLIEIAKQDMGVGDGPTEFSENVLRIAISGPEMIPLTLVDLPGFYHGSGPKQSQASASIVNRLAKKYMRHKNTIILAVMSANYNMELQSVIEEARKCDPEGERTMGIITKPDCVPSPSERRRYVDLANNEVKEYRLRLGWHVLRNRGEDDAEAEDDVRDANEESFFSQGVWSDVQRRNRGIKELRKKLSKTLVEHISRCMPGLVAEIEEKRLICQDQLSKLGQPRSSPGELRAYLSNIFAGFRAISLDAIRGQYSDPFFGSLFPHDDALNLVSTDFGFVSESACDETRSKKLRGYVRDLNRVFDAVMRNRGHKLVITEKPPNNTVPLDRHLKQLKDWKYKFSRPGKTSLSDLKKQVRPVASINQGIEFPGIPNNQIALELFREQIKPWRGIASHHIEIVTNLTKSFVEQLMTHLVGSDQKTLNAILRLQVDPFFEKTRDDMDKKLEELLVHYETGYPQPLAHDSSTTLTLREKHRGSFRNKLLSAERQSGFGTTLTALMEVVFEEGSDEDEDDFEVEYLIEMMLAYYNVSLLSPNAHHPTDAP